MNNRIVEIDILKGIAIFFVVWGHCIQFFAQPNYDFFSNVIFKTIYSFHMPLFMALSGYLFYPTLFKKGWVDIIDAKFRQLILPVLLWYTLLRLLSGDAVDLKYLLISVIHGVWFIGTLFVLIVISCISVRVSKKYYGFLLLGFFIIIMVTLPDSHNIVMVKFMMPYFLFGMLVNSYKVKIKKIPNKIIFITTILWLLCLIGWGNKHYIYTSGIAAIHYKLHEQIELNLYRYMAGFFGVITVSYFTFISARMLDVKKIFSRVGQYTFPIYILQTFIFSFIQGHDYFKLKYNLFIYSVIVTPLLAGVIISVIIFFSIFLEKNTYTRKYLLGGR